MTALLDLSKRERDIVTLLTSGLSNREMAVQLGIQEKTVKFHLTNVYKKYNVKSRSKLIVQVLTNNNNNGGIDNVNKNNG